MNFSASRVLVLPAGLCIPPAPPGAASAPQGAAAVAPNNPDPEPGRPSRRVGSSRAPRKLLGTGRGSWLVLGEPGKGKGKGKPGKGEPAGEGDHIW